ncbi:hypothetical protein V2J09_013131 [Rumex salicifolius]
MEDRLGELTGRNLGNSILKLSQRSPCFVCFPVRLRRRREARIKAAFVTIAPYRNTLSNRSVDGGPAQRRRK